MLYLYAALLTLVNALWLALVAAGLPGNWLMVLTSTTAAWLLPEHELAGRTSLIAAASMALLGEVMEFVLGAAGAKKAGASRTGSAMSIVGALIGGIACTFLIPVPLLGTLIGACAGAFIGAMAGEGMVGRSIAQAMAAGRGAAVGRFWGTAVKLATGVMIWLTLTAAAFF
jgi:hypothetical protein